MGIFGDQIADGTLPEAKLDAATQTKLGDALDASDHAGINHAGLTGVGDVNPADVSQGEAEAGTVTANRTWSPERVAQAIAALASGGGTPAPSVTRTAVGSLSSADNGKTFDNTGATDRVVIVADAGLADGFEFRLVQTITAPNDTDSLVGAELAFLPQPTERIEIGEPLTSKLELGEGILLVGGGQSFLARTGSMVFKLINGRWARLEQGSSAAAFSFGAQLRIKDLDAVNGIGSVASILNDANQQSGNFVFTIKDEGGPVTILGTQDSGTGYADGGALASVDKVYLEIQNVDGLNAFLWGGPLLASAFNAVNIRPASVADGNLKGNAFGFNYRPNEYGAGITIPAGGIATFWLDVSTRTVPYMYQRSVGGGPVTTFATAILGQPI